MRYINFFNGKQACSAFLISALGLSASPSALAEAQFYLLAKPAPVASLTGTARSPEAVYLRWDLVEGGLPADISGFRLYRDGTLIGDFPASGAMPEADIAALYQGPHQQRRLLERVSALKEEATRDDSVEDFPVSQFAGRIHERLTSGEDSFWASFTATQDFNVAAARYRATYDYPGTGTFAYELKAVSTTAAERRIGYAEVDTTQPARVLANQNFSQILQSACDEPDFRDHYTVALNWDGPQTGSQADELAHRLFVGGYDLYRTTSNLDDSVLSAPLRDLAAEAATTGADAQGQVQFTDLERVNDVLVLSQPDNTPTPEWLETREDLIRAGLKPGDKRAYYLVARDFTGQFGPTMATIVTVPDMARPPAPWDIRVYLDEAQQHAELNFPAINVTSYLERAGDTREICLTDAAADGIIEFVPEGKNCLTTPTTRVHTHIDKYMLYRFDSFDAASRFKDSDGDGYADMDERLTGSQCVPASNTGPALVAADIPADAGTDPQGRIRITDPEAALNKGYVYWYRIAAKSKGGNYSLLTEPVRVNFPDRTLPDAPRVTLTRPSDRVCGCSVTYLDDGSPWSLAVSDPMNPNSITASCQGADLGLSKDELLDPAYADSTYDVFRDHCAKGEMPLFGLTGYLPGTSCKVTPEYAGNFYRSGQMTIEPEYCDTPELFAGGFSGRPVTIDVEGEAGTCVSIYQRIGDLSSRVASSCEEGVNTLTFEHDKGEFCGYAVAQDSNNNISSIESIPCSVGSDNSAPAPVTPRLSDLLLGSDEATLHWRSPVQPQTVNEVELERTAPAGIAPMRTTVAALSGGDLQANFTLPAQTSATEEWCARVRAYGPSADIHSPQSSPWSAPVCVTRSTSVPPAWLPWPVAEPVPQGEDLTVINNRVALSPIRSPLSNGLHIPLVGLSQGNVKSCLKSLTRSGSAESYALNSGHVWLHIECDERNVSRLKAIIDPALNMMVFRQARRPDGQISDLIQVSPLLMNAFWNPDAQPNPDDPEAPVRDDVSWLNDPYIWMRNDYTSSDDDAAVVAFVDRAGLVSGWEYRYQIVWFDDRQVMREWRMSDWTAYSTGGAQ